MLETRPQPVILDVMSKDAVFECPHCGQWLEAPADMIGLFIECPKCEAIVKIPREGEAAQLSGAGKTELTPPPKPSTDEDQEQLKGSTIRITLPPNFGMPPETPKRRFVIRRKGS